MTVVFAELNNKRVEFVQMFCSMLGGKSSLDREADFVVRRTFGKNLMPSEEPFCIGIHDENGIFAGIQKNGVSGFRANAVEGKQLMPEMADFIGGTQAEHPRDAAAVLAVEIGNKVLDAAGFLPEISGGANQLRQFVFRQRAQRGKIERSFATKIRDGALHVLPGCVLCEKCADDDFEAGSTRPPVLRAVFFPESHIMRVDALVSRFSFLVSRDCNQPTQTKRMLERHPITSKSGTRWGPRNGAPVELIGTRKFYELPALI